MVFASALWNGLRKSSIHSQANRKPADCMQFKIIQNARKTQFLVLPNLVTVHHFALTTQGKYITYATMTLCHKDLVPLSSLMLVYIVVVYNNNHLILRNGEIPAVINAIKPSTLRV